jgi:hypothetical protein
LASLVVHLNVQNSNDCATPHDPTNNHVLALVAVDFRFEEAIKFKKWLDGLGGLVVKIVAVKVKCFLDIRA